jgi:hypothetical protein
MDRHLSRLRYAFNRRLQLTSLRRPTLRPRRHWFRLVAQKIGIGAFSTSARRFIMSSVIDHSF